MRRVLVILTLAALLLNGVVFSSMAAGPAGVWGTGIQVQNLSDSEVATVTISFRYGQDMVGIPAGKSPGDEAATQTMTIQPGKSGVVYVPSGVPSRS